MSNHLHQHRDDLDFVQDFLKETGRSKELNPILNSVLAGFGRRRRHGRFKCGQLNMHFDQLRFADTKTQKDDDRKVKDLVEKTLHKTSSFSNSLSICRYFQQRQGCRFGSRDCRFAHKCSICNMPIHRAITCYTREQSIRADPDPVGSEERRRPPNPRTRRERANNTRSNIPF